MDIFGAQLAEMRKQNEQKKQDSPRAAKQDTPQATSQRSTGDPYGDQLAALRKEQAAKQRPQSLNAADALADVAGRITKAAADKKGTDLNKQRSSLMNQLQTVQDSAAYITDPDAANANKAEERRIINQLNVLDRAQGNADRYYSNADRAGGVLRSWGNRTAGSYLSTAAFGGQLAEAQDETGRILADSAYAGYLTDPLAIEQARAEVEKGWRPESMGVFKTNREMLAKADELLSRGERESAKVYEGAGKADRILADLATGALDLGADSLASAILPGSGLFAMGARTFGQGTYEQRKEGGSLGKQFLNGAKSAAIEILTEKIGGPFDKIYGKSMTGKAVNAFVSRFDNPIVQRGLSILSGAFSEGVEEFLSDFLNPVADRLLQLDDGTGKIFKEGWLQNALYDALIGGILGALGEGVKVAPGQRNAPSIEAAKDNAVRGALEAVDRAAQEQAQAETAEAAQKPTEAPTMPQGAEIPESTEEAPTAAPVELNSAPAIAEAEATPETAPEAAPEAAPPAVETPTEAAAAKTVANERVTTPTVQSRSTKPGDHIDKRNAASVGSRGVKAFQYDHPEIRPFYAKAAQYLMEDFGASIQSDMNKRKGGRGYHKTQLIDRAMREFGLSRNQAMAALQQIINDNGAENNAAAKRMELLLDDMLTNGYWPVDRAKGNFQADPAYLEAKGKISGGNSTSSDEYRIQKAIESEIQAAMLNGETLTEEQARENVMKEYAETGYYGIGDRAALSQVDAGRATDYDGTRNGGDSDGEAGQFERPDAGTDPGALAGREAGTGAAEYDGGGAAGGPGPVGGQNRLASLGVQERAELTSRVADATKNLTGGYLAEVQKLDAAQRDPVLYDIADMLVSEYDNGTDISGFAGELGDLTEILGILDGAVTESTAAAEESAGTAETEAADAGGSEELPETVGQGTPERGLAAYEPAGVGEVRGPGSLAPDGEVSGETGSEPGEAGGINEPAAGPKPIPDGAKLSKYWEHTLRTVEEAANAPDEVKQPLWYMPVTEVQSLAKAASRLAEDKQGTIEDLVESEAWNGVQYDAATMVADQLYAEGLKTGDMSGYEAWRLVLKEHVGDTARGLQAVKKTTRHTGRTAVDSVIDQMADSGLPKPVKNEVITEAANFGKELDSIKEGDTESLKDLVKRLAERRRNGTIFRGNMDKLLNKQSEAWMREAAYRQIDALGRDAANRGLKNIGAKIASYNVLSMLSGIPTVARNLVGNGIFNPIDMFAANGPGRAIDALLGQATGQRAVVGHRAPFWQTVPAWFKNAADAMGTSMLEIALDIDTNENRSTPFMPANSAFIADSNPIERLFQRWTQIMGYALTSTDRFSRGGIESGELANYEAYDAKRAEKGKRGTGLSAEEKADLSQKTAEYRLFQQQTKLSQGEKAVRRWLNNAVGFGGKVSADGTRTKDNTFGLGSVLMPFVEVPTNLALKTLEWGPGNLAAATKDLITLGKFVHENNISSDGNKVSTAALQQKVSMEAARGLTGTALLVLCTALARMGLIRNGDDEDDYDVAAVNNITGQKGTQFNISATERSLTGGSTEWKPGDIVIGLGGISPLDMWLNAGTRFAALEEAENPMDWIGSRGQAYLQAAYQSTLDIPMFQTMADFQDTLRNAEKMDFDTAADLVGDLADNQMSKIVPQFVRQSVRANDPYYRDTSSDSWMQERVNNAMQYLPFARQNLPTAVDSFGNPKEQQKESERWINALLSPTPFSTYRSNDVIDMLTDLKNESGKDSFYPDRKPPKAVEIPDASGNGKETLQLNTEQKRAYQQTYGSTYTELASGLMESDSWGRMSTDEKLKAMANVEAFAKDAAKRALSESLGREYSSDWDDEDALARENLGGFIGTKTALNSAIKNKDYKAVDALLGDIDKMDKATKEQLYADVNRLDDRVAAHKAGIDTVLWEAAYAQKKKLEEDKNTTAVQDTISFAQWADSQKDLNRKQKDLLRDQMGFYTTFRADAEKFDKLTETGLSADKAGKVWNAINALQPLEGHAGVTQNQRLKAISSMGNLSDAEKWSVLELYASESAYKKAMDAKAKGWTFEQWVQSFTKGK